MSIWDHIKPSKPVPSASSIDVSADKRSVTITWDDAVQSTLSARRLRQVCPCAGCVDEWTKALRHDPQKVPENTTVQDVRQVGNYAVAFLFSDNHSTGIFTWPLLRELSEKGPAAPAAG